MPRTSSYCMNCKQLIWHSTTKLHSENSTISCGKIIKSRTNQIYVSLLFCRNSLRRIATNDDTEFSRESIVNLMEKFVKTVNVMDETILVPCRLMDRTVSVSQKPNTTSFTHQISHRYQQSVWQMVTLPNDWWKHVDETRLLEANAHQETIVSWLFFVVDICLRHFSVFLLQFVWYFNNNHK